MQSFIPALPPVPVQYATAPTALVLRALVPPGAIVEARVLSQSVATVRQATYDVLLSIGSQVLKVSTSQPLQAGSQVRLTSNAGLQLQVIPSAAAWAKNDNLPPVKADSATPVKADSVAAAKSAPGGLLKNVVVAPAANAISTPAKNNVVATATNNVGAPAANIAAGPSRRGEIMQRIEGHIDQALRSALPREQPMQQALRTMQRILNTTDKPLPDATRQLVREVFARLPDLAAVQDPRRLPDALRLSGMFLENALVQLTGAGANSNLGDDLRVTLLRLAANLKARLPENNAVVRPGPGDREAVMLQQVQSALARLKVHQLSTLNTRLHNQPDTAAAPRLSMELPFLHGAQIESVQLTIGKEDARPEAPEAARQPAWTADLDFELGELGPLHIRARLQNAWVSTVFWAPRDATLTLVKANIATLREELARHDIQLRHITYQKGLPPARQLHPRPLIHVAI